MLKPLLWLLFSLCMAWQASVVQARDDRERVHIKVHMPDMSKTHTHYHHKVLKHRPRHHHRHQAHKLLSPPPIKHLTKLPPQHIELGYYTSDQDDAGAHFQLPELAPNYGPALFDNDISTSGRHPMAAALTATTQMPAEAQAPLPKHMMQHLFTPDVMSALAGGDSNALMTDDFLTELGREYGAQYAEPAKSRTPAKQRPVKTNKRKKYANTEMAYPTAVAYQQHYQHAQPQQQQQYYSQRPYYHSKQPTRTYSDSADEDDDSSEESFDDKSSTSSELTLSDYGAYTPPPSSYQDMYGAYATTAASSSHPPTAATHLKWRHYLSEGPSASSDFVPLQPYEQPSQHPNPYAGLYQPHTKLASSPQPPPQQSQHHKKRKNRIKANRNRIVVQ